MATLTPRLDLLAQATETLLALDERRSLLEDLHERPGAGVKDGGVRGQPSDVMSCAPTMAVAIRQVAHP